MKSSNACLKGLFFWALFLIFYFVYKYIPWAPLKIICAVSESNFQHYKAAFFSWIILSSLEYLICKRKITVKSAFFYSRLSTATIMPWFVFILWYIGPAVYGKMPNVPLEIFYANLITVISGISAGIFEKGIEGINYSRELKALIIIMALASLLLYIVFTFVKLPWADVFIEPDWR